MTNDSGKERVNFSLPHFFFLSFSLPSLFLSSCHPVSSCSSFLSVSFRHSVLLDFYTNYTHIRKFYLWIVVVCVCLNTTLCFSQSHVFFISPYKQMKAHLLSLSPALIAIINIIGVHV